MINLKRAVPALLVTAAASVLAFTNAANAQLMGNDLTAQWWYPDFGSVLESHVVNVSNSIELTADDIINDFKFDIDIDDNTVEFIFNSASSWTNANFNGWYFNDVNGTIPTVTGYTIDSYSAGITGTENIVTGYDDDSFWADFGGMNVAGGGDWIVLRVEFGFTLNITGNCNTSFDVNISGGEAGAKCAFAWGSSSGSTPVPPCPGLSVDIARADAWRSYPNDVLFVNLDGNGNFTFNKAGGPNFCGKLVQVVDLDNCATTNVEVVP